MGFLTDVFPSRNKSPPRDVPKEATEATSPPPTDPVATNDAPSAKPPGDAPPASQTSPISQADKPEPEASPLGELPDKTKNPSTSPSLNRRFSVQNTLGLLRKAKPSPSNIDAQGASAPTAPKVAEVAAKKGITLLSSDRRAKESALVLRTLIVGQNSGAGSTVPPARVSPTQLNTVKAQLLQPKTANPVITQLKALPALSDSSSQKITPIRAVCLPYPDDVVVEKHFSQLRSVEATKEPTEDRTLHLPTITSATSESIIESFKALHIVSLFTAPDLGLGQPGNGSGLLAGALPTAETVISGIEKITPQLMTLSYATGKSIMPDHTGVHPHVDRMSCLTYWWGLELLLPPPTLTYLGRAESISNTVMTFLTAMSVMNDGVREILPFIRYFSQYIEIEWKSIKAQDHGKGVICAATWIMPLALVPRPWDFPDPPKVAETSAGPSTKSAPSDAKAPAKAPAAASTPTASGEKAEPSSSSSPPEEASGSPPSPAPAGHGDVPEVAKPDSA
jgi:hypothetical protein